MKTAAQASYLPTVGESFHEVLLTGGIKLIARSAKAVIVRLGLTPRFAATTEPSQMYMFL